MKTILFTNARDECNIKEWVAHHLNLGFDHIYIFDHKSKIPISTIFKPNNNITIERVILNGKIKAVLVHRAINISRRKYDWMLYLDADEFLYLNNHNNIMELLNEYSKYNQLCINWLLFGSNYLTKEPVGNILENYIRCNKLLDKNIKSFVRPHTINSNIIGHLYITHNMNGGININSHKHINMYPHNVYQYDRIHFNDAICYIAHYKWQSYDRYNSRKVDLPRDDNNLYRPPMSEIILHSLDNSNINVMVRDKYNDDNNILMEKL